MADYHRLSRFPLGAIQAEGFLKDQLLLGKDGMAGHLPELEPGMIADPFINKSYVPAWGDGDQSGWGAEISGNYWTGYIQHAFVLNDAEMIATATDWVDTMMKKQRPDGYLGTYYEEDASIYEDYNAWGTACAMRGLIAFYEATGRADVLDAVYRCMLWFCENWAGEKKTSYSGPFIIEPMVFCYYYTGDERLIRFCEEYQEYLIHHDLFKNSWKAYLYEDLHYLSNHTSALGAIGRLPALLYSATGKKEYLQATERLIRNLRQKGVQPTGGPVSYAEYLGPKGALGESEYCSFAFHNAMYAYMAYITGRAEYGDYMEEMFYNAAQGARKKDEKAIAYLSAPNQAYATNRSSTAGAELDMQVYAPCYPVSCCPVNAVALVPEFIRGLFLQDDVGSIYAPAYGPCKVKGEHFTLEEKTHYPFRHEIRFELNADREMSVFLKVSQWATGYRISVNGEEYTAEKNADGYAEVCCRAGQTVIALHFDAEVEVLHVDDSDGSAKYPLCIKYGALVYSYHIPERWEAYPGRPMTALPEGWSWFNVLPEYEPPKAADPHDAIGMRREAISWNIALDEQLRPEDIAVEELPESGYVWSHPMIRLHTKCYKAPFLYPPYPKQTTEFMGARQYVTGELPLTLVPYGCTNLRITFFPRADLDTAVSNKA